MTLEELVGWFRANRLTFFHFTDERNIPLIKEHGLLSNRELVRRGLKCLAPGGNQWSIDADVRTGMDRYVHLCLRKQHPMEYMARQEGRIQASRFLRIDPDVLLIGGAQLTDGVSNKTGVNRGDPIGMMHAIDWEVLYLRTNWKDPAIQERLKVASKYEVLIPDAVPVASIRYL